jgi:hypothetical protein
MMMDAADINFVFIPIRKRVNTLVQNDQNALNLRFCPSESSVEIRDNLSRHDQIFYDLEGGSC